MSNTRFIALQLLLPVIQKGAHFHAQLVEKQYPKLIPNDRGFVRHLCFGTLRYYGYLEHTLKTWLKKPLKSKDKDIHVLLILGLYQLFYTQSARHAILHETVEVCELLQKSWAKGLVNAILRDASLFEKPQNALTEAYLSHPEWLIAQLKTHWPNDWKTILLHNQQHPPMTLRINRQKISKSDYLQQLSDQNQSADEVAESPVGLQLATEVGVEKLPGFAEGLASVQDLSAQLAAPLLMLADGQRVLDACAAPGGKTAHILESHDVSMVALDADETRFARLQSTLSRLSLHANLILADAAKPHAWWDNIPFDRILCDAPCSGTGVIRRHPDILLNRQWEEIAFLQEQQAQLLDALWPLLKPGGILLYATCSILPAENVDTMAAFFRRHGDAIELPIVANWGIAQTVGRQILQRDNMDGFYYARVQKRA